ncbi:hypothetical protein [Actinacidiphila glaucinigra]|uniref:hypothetical protein n=1 Tax=Actinacidiphila glaucinigra TaxID=235986 RepID=UPI003672F4CF
MTSRMTPLERLLLEEVPVRPDRPGGAHSLWTKQEQDRHWADLANAVGRPGEKRPEPAAEAAA